MVLEVIFDCAGLATTPKLDPRVCDGLEPLVVVADAMHGTPCFWHSAQTALSDGTRWHLLRRELYYHTTVSRRRNQSRGGGGNVPGLTDRTRMQWAAAWLETCFIAAALAGLEE
jgi:hypothetical protein